MSHEKIRIASLDFETIKEDFKQYLSGRPEFQGAYDFEGPNLTVLLNLLAYNTHYQAVMANFVANEMFMDTAVKRSSVVSHAKALGYTPYSDSASKALVNLVISNVPGNPSTYLLPKGTQFRTTIDNSTFVFSTYEAHLANRETNNTYVFTDIQIYQGSWTRNTLFLDHTFPFIELPNAGADLSTLTVQATHSVNNEALLKPFSKASTFLTLDENSLVYFVQEGMNRNYQVYFGDGVLGYKPIDGAEVRLEYIVTDGLVANGAAIFTLASVLDGVISVTTSSSATGGRNREGTESIKFNALNYFGSQDRAVVPEDYKSIISANFNNVKSILVWGGEDQVPPEYGKVIFCIIPEFGDVLTEDEKNDIVDFIKPKAVANARYGFIDPEYIDVKLDVVVKYNRNELEGTPSDLELLVLTAITDYSETVLSRFSGVYRNFDIIRDLDRLSESVLAVNVSASLVKEVEPELFVERGITFTFGQTIDKSFSAASVRSSNFYSPEDSTPLFFEDDKSGKINISYFSGGNKFVKQSSVGTVDYSTGLVTIDALIIADFDGDFLTFTCSPNEQDIYSIRQAIVRLQNKYLTIKLISE